MFKLLFQRRNSQKKDILACSPELRRSVLLMFSDQEATSALEKKGRSEKIQSIPSLNPPPTRKIRSREDLEKYLQLCSTQPPLAEGHGCKDVTSGLRNLDKYRRRYFVLYSGILLYYDHKSNYIKDKRNGLKHSKGILLEDLYLTKPERALPNARFSFYLHAPHKMNKREKMLFVVQTKKARHMWIEQLQAQNPQLVTPAHHSKTHRQFSYSD